jgi:hypothetical protein
MAKKKRRGHYCRICGEWKANEKFSGKGHAAHVCRECASLPQQEKNEMRHMGRIERIAEKYPRSREDWEYLERCAKNTGYPQAAEFARMVLGMSGREPSADNGKKKTEMETYADTLAYGELDEDFRNEAGDWLEELIVDFIVGTGHFPDEEKHRKKIANTFCREVSRELEINVVCDTELEKLFSEVFKNIRDVEEESAPDDE